MRYRQFAVPPLLSPWVECVWRLTGDRDPAAPAQPVCPDGCLELVIHAGDAFRARLGDGVWTRQPDRLIVGQMSQPVTLAPLGRVDVWGVRAHPWGGGIFVDGPISHLTDRIEHAGDVSPALARALADAVEEGGADDTQTVAALCRVLAPRARRLAAPDPLCVRTAARLLASPTASLAQLAGESGVSERQFERRFLASVGLTAKTFARIARFQRVCGLLDAAPETLAAAAIDAGYYDQSHLVRDVRAFAGRTPSLLLHPGTPLTEHFLRARRMSGFSKTSPLPLA